MLRGYRRIIIAAVGWLTLAAAQQPAEHKNSNQSGAQTTKTAKSSLPPAEASSVNEVDNFTAYPGYNPDPCYRAKSHDEADLCAQWRAAIAAEKSAHEARRATNWSVAATFLSFIAVVGLIVTIWQTSGALGEARRGNILAMRENARATRRAAASARETVQALDAAVRSADAADKHVQIAEQSAQAQIRAYIVAERVFFSGMPTEKFICIEVIIKNAGLTPARITKVTAGLWIAPATYKPIELGPNPKIYYHLKDWFPQGTEDSIRIYQSNNVDFGKLNGEDGFSIHVYGRIEYTDVFDKRRWMTFAYRERGWV